MEHANKKSPGAISSNKRWIVVEEVIKKLFAFSLFFVRTRFSEHSFSRMHSQSRQGLFKGFGTRPNKQKLISGGNAGGQFLASRALDALLAK